MRYESREQAERAAELFNELYAEHRVYFQPALIETGDRQHYGFECQNKHGDRLIVGTNAVEWTARINAFVMASR